MFSLQKRQITSLYLQVVVLMVSTITRAYAIRGMLEEIVIKTLMTVPHLPVFTVSV